MSAEDKPSIPYVKSLDGLRGLAILLVLFDHWAPWKGIHDIGELGRTGLLLFFMLSGYLITSALLKIRTDVGDRTISLRQGFTNFYMRRILRILPIYLVVLLLAMLVHELNWRGLLSHLLFLQNFTAGYAAAPIYGFLTPLWSLAVEEQFYLFWAPVVLLLLNNSQMLKVCIAAIVVSIMFKFFCTVFEISSWTFWTMRMYTLGNIDSLALGSAVAIDHKYHLVNWKEGLGKKINTAAIYLVIPIIGGFILVNEMYGFKIVRDIGFYMVFHDTYMQLPLWVALRAALRDRHGWMKNKLLVWIGKRSYGIYVWHQPVKYAAIFFSANLFSYPLANKYSLLSFIIFFSLVCLTAEFSWRFIEMPFLRYKTKWS